MQLRQLIRAFRIITGGFPEVEFIRVRTPGLQVDGTFKQSGQLQLFSGDVTYGPTIVTDLALGSIQDVTITDGVAFAMSAPLNPPPVGYSVYLTYIFKNLSGGAAGAVTWNAVFHLVGAWTAPANAKASIIQFVWDHTYSVWVETFRSTADIA